MGHVGGSTLWPVSGWSCLLESMHLAVLLLFEDKSKAVALDEKKPIINSGAGCTYDHYTSKLRHNITKAK